VPLKQQKPRKKEFQIVHIVPLDTMPTKLKFGNLPKWTLTTLQLGAKEEQQTQRIVKCFVRHITEQKAINKFSFYLGLTELYLAFCCYLHYSKFFNQQQFRADTILLLRFCQALPLLT
jgi:hypothetical protein